MRSSRDRRHPPSCVSQAPCRTLCLADDGRGQRKLLHMRLDCSKFERHLSSVAKAAGRVIHWNHGVGWGKLNQGSSQHSSTVLRDTRTTQTVSLAPVVTQHYFPHTVLVVRALLVHSRVVGPILVYTHDTNEHLPVPWEYSVNTLIVFPVHLFFTGFPVRLSYLRQNRPFKHHQTHINRHTCSVV